MVMRFDYSNALMGKGRDTLFNSLSEADSGNRVLAGLATTQRGAGANMSVDVAAGNWIAGGVGNVTSSTTNVVISAAHATYDRYDLITGDNASAIAVVTGTAAAVPQVPALPANKIPLAVVSVPANDTTIETSQCVDVRSLDPRGEHLITSGSFSSSANLDLTSITQAFNFLSLSIDLTLSTDADITLVVNNDSPANKHASRRILFGAAVSSGAFDGDANLNISPTNTSYLKQHIEGYFPFYSGARTKGFEIMANQLVNATNANIAYVTYGSFDDTGAITQLTLAPSTGNFASGSYRLYGWY